MSTSKTAKASMGKKPTQKAHLCSICPSEAKRIKLAGFGIKGLKWECGNGHWT